MTLAEQAAAFPPILASVAGGVIEYRHAGARPGTAPALVLLHGIGSASASWLAQLQQLANGRCVLAWNAPGYGASSALPQETPAAADYGQRVWEWLDALGAGDITLVGHSLGALMAAAASVLQPARVKRLVLLAPALGYADADPAVREAKMRDRLANLANLGPAGLAEKRGAAMLSPAASAEQVAYIKSVMAQIDPHGYSQATRMLAGGSLARDLARVTCPVTVACGSMDTITPPGGCQRAAPAARTTLIDLGPVGHACALEAADAVNHLLDGAAA